MSDAQEPGSTSSQPVAAYHLMEDQPATPLPLDRDFISDFEHLGLAVKADEADESTKLDAGATEATRSSELPVAPLRPDEHLAPEPQHRVTTVRADGVAPSGTKLDVGATEAIPPVGYARDTAETSSNVAVSLRRKAALENLQQTIAPANAQEESTRLPSKPDTIETNVASPVTHETIKLQNHEIRQEVVHRDIHEYHEVTRILPVIDRVYLPARHFAITADGQKVEIPPPFPDEGFDYSRRP